MPNGLTNESMLERIYTELVGLDGQGGMLREVREAKEGRSRLHSRIDHVETNAVTHKDCMRVQEELPAKIEAVVQKAIEKKGRNKWLVIKDVVIIAGVVLTLLLGSSLLPRMMANLADSVRAQVQQEMEENDS